MAVQQCLVLIKPDGMVKSLAGSIMSILSQANLKIIGTKIVKVSRELAEKHYGDLKERKIKQHGVEKGTQIYENTMKYIQGTYHTDRVLAIVYSGEDAIERIRMLAGATNPEEAEPTTIRGKFGRISMKTGTYENAMHASDSDENAKREIQLWFKPEELTEDVYPTKKVKVQGQITVWA
jgi:nucleoside-diphosphate kinase